MRAILFTLMLLPCAVAVPATVYKWVDQNGVTHYSDQPKPGAEQVQVESAQRSSSTATPSPGYSTPPSDIARAPQPTRPAYTSCNISSPQNEAVFFNVTSVSGSVNLSPSLLSGHKLTVTLDGKPIEGISGTTTSFTVSPVYRGSHTVNVLVEDASGAVLCQSPGVTFHIRQPSVQAPNRANRPRF